MIRPLLAITSQPTLSDFDELFERFFRAPNQESGARGSSTVLPIDLYERDNTLYVRAAVPGIDPEDVSISIEDNVLTIKGETWHETEENTAKVYRREVASGSFTRSVRLPDNLDLTRVDAEFKNGMVTVSLPRSIEEKPEPIRVPIRKTVSSVDPSTN